MESLGGVMMLLECQCTGRPSAIETKRELRRWCIGTFRFGQTTLATIAFFANCDLLRTAPPRQSELAMYLAAQLLSGNNQIEFKLF
eukprot:4042320-Amphidinium_carterae.4